MNVTSMVTRYSAILPSATLAFCSSTCSPMIPRSVLPARVSPSRTASSKLSGDAAVIFETLATAISTSLRINRPRASLDRLIQEDYSTTLGCGVQNQRKYTAKPIGHCDATDLQWQLLRQNK